MHGALFQFWKRLNTFVREWALIDVIVNATSKPPISDLRPGEADSPRRPMGEHATSPEPSSNGEPTLATYGGF
jgi:hypothetical protein